MHCYVVYAPSLAHTVCASQSATELQATLDSTHEWPFQELADLLEWSKVLNKLDSYISACLLSDPSLMLIKSTASTTTSSSSPTDLPPPTEALTVPTEQAEATLHAILRFTALLLPHSLSKHVYNSTSHLILLLSTPSPSLLNLTLTCLCHLSSPPLLQRQQFPEQNQHHTSLHSSNTAAEKLLVLARGWGSQGGGLGLLTVIAPTVATTPPLPADPADLRFSYYLPDGSSPSLIHIDAATLATFKDTTAIFDHCLTNFTIPTNKYFALLARIR